MLFSFESDTESFFVKYYLGALVLKSNDPIINKSGKRWRAERGLSPGNPIAFYLSFIYRSAFLLQKMFLA